MQKNGAISAILIVSLLTTSSTGLNADDRLKKDRRRMAVVMASIAASLLVMAAGTISFNPVIAGAGVALFGAGSGLVGGGGYMTHKIEDRRAQATSASSQPAQVETLVAVSQRPGYYYHPSNPNQLYVDPSEAVDSMPAKLDGPPVAAPARITVKIANAAHDGRSITCTIDGTPFSVAPGYTQTLVAAPGSVIAYETGNRLAIDRSTQAEGSYEFRSVENNWRFDNQEPASSVASGPTQSSPTPGASVPR